MKKIFILFVFVVFYQSVSAQNTIPIYWTSTYDADTSIWQSYLKDTALYNTAVDLKNNLQKACGSNFVFNVLPMPQTSPTSGIVLLADTSLPATNFESCSILGNDSILTFTAKHPMGVAYGVYEYLDDLGFRFYLPDTLWEIIPTLTTPFTTVNKFVQPLVSMRQPVLTGGMYQIPTDSLMNASRDWYLWIDRNNMNSEYVYSGHNDIDSSLHTKFSNINCSIAEHDSSVAIQVTSIANATNPLAVDAYGEWITKFWKDYGKQTNNIPYRNKLKSIDLPDGVYYGNTNYFGCALNGEYPSPSDQRFTILNRATEIMQDSMPNSNTFGFAYVEAADTPSVVINPMLNVGVTMGFQFAASNVALMHRWKSKMPDITKLSEYNYLNLPDGGQYPYANMEYFINCNKRSVDWGTDGVIIETGISKFSTAIHLYALNNYLKTGKDVLVSQNQFYNDMFGSAATPIAELFNLWTSEGCFTDGGAIRDNKHKFPKYFQLLDAADAMASGNAKSRVKEIKAYLHYVLLHDNYVLSKRSELLNNATILCQYIAQTTHLKLINTARSMELLAYDDTLMSLDSTFNRKWDPFQVHYQWKPGVSGSVDPNWATITPLTESDIDLNFSNDVALFSGFNATYTFEDDLAILNTITSSGLEAKDTVNFNLSYESPATNFTIKLYSNGAPLKIIYDSIANSVSNENVRISFSLDSEDQLSSVGKEINSIDGTNGQFDLIVPSAGFYYLTLGKTTLGGGNFHVVTNGNVLYRVGNIYPAYFERFESIKEAASYIYVPTGIDKIYLTMLDVCTSSLCLSDSVLNGISTYKNSIDSSIFIHRSQMDSGLFYLDVPMGMDGKFWQVYHHNNNNYSMSLANISNFYYWLQPANPNKVKWINALNFNIVPNPNNGHFNINLNAEGNVNINVYDLLGKKQAGFSFSNWDGSEKLNLSALNSGMYVVTVNCNGEKSSKKITILK
ncbi:MAG: T9SS type A sorting domain-containing protein [Bacteroidia bacterium]|nr:T9SS type A sorting domain-containing protein [Bacteroidia bacterium]